jgi:hypothetical protein
MGNRLYRKTIRRTVVHELGHFTFYAACPDNEYLIEEMCVDLFSGHVTHAGHPPRNFRTIVGLLSGLAAEKIIRREKNPYLKYYDSTDMTRARDIAYKIDRDNQVEIMRAGRVAAEQFVRANRKQIVAVVRTLCRMGAGDIDVPRLMARLKQLPPLTEIPPREPPPYCQRIPERERNSSNVMTLEEFLIAFNPDDCDACMRFGYECPPPFHNFLTDMRNKILAILEEDEENNHPRIMAQHLVGWIDSERDLFDCAALLEAFKKASGELIDEADDEEKTDGAER